jgi:hypothetical protein
VAAESNWAAPHAEPGANLRDLMNRMGHHSTRAALIHLHARDHRDREIAVGLDRIVTQELNAPKGSVGHKHHSRPAALPASDRAGPGSKRTIRGIHTRFCSARRYLAAHQGVVDRASTGQVYAIAGLGHGLTRSTINTTVRPALDKLSTETVEPEIEFECWVTWWPPTNLGKSGRP